MKNTIKVVMALVFCLSLASQAKAFQHSKRKSLDLRMASGHYQETVTMNKAVQSQDRVPVTGMDLDWLFHKRFLGLSWGPIVRYRSVKTPAGKLNYIGVGGSVGYISNTFEDKNRWPVGWHTHLGVAFGKLSQVSPAYKQEPLVGLGTWNFGLDFKLHGWDSSEPGKYKSALVASVDYGTESLLVGLTDKANPTVVGGLTAIGWVPKAGLSYYW